jgi:hypothetical protein
MKRFLKEQGEERVSATFRVLGTAPPEYPFDGCIRKYSTVCLQGFLIEFAMF